MGNSIRDALGNPRIPCHIVLGRSASIELSTKTRKKFDDGGFWEDWDMSYTGDEKTCYCTLVRDYDKDNNVNKVSFVLLHLEWRILRLQIEGTETGFLRINWTRGQPPESITWNKTNRTVDACGRVVDTKVYLYRSGNSVFLVVLEWKKNSANDEEVDEVTVAHYFACSSGRGFEGTESGIGLSVVSKIRVYNSKLDIMVEGPQQHPASALFYMFEEVDRIGIWNPTMCPHCDETLSTKSSISIDN